VHRGDQHGGQRSYVGACPDPPEVPLGREVPADHGRGLGDEGDARAGGGAQPGAQLVPRDNQPDEREDRRAEQPGDRGGQVARDTAGSRRGAQVRRLTVDPGDPVKRELGEERVEVGEVPVQDWARPYTRDEWLDLVPTTGGFGGLPDDTQAEVLGRLGAAVDATGGTFTMGYTTLAVTAVRLAP
jgi:hypothetical protein